MSDHDPLDVPQQWRPEQPRAALDAAPLAPPPGGRATHRGIAQPASDVRIIGEAPVQPAQQPDGSRGIVQPARPGTGPLCGSCGHHQSDHSSFGCLVPGCARTDVTAGGACRRWRETVTVEAPPEPVTPPAPTQPTTEPVTQIPGHQPPRAQPPAIPGVQIPGAGWVE